MARADRAAATYAPPRAPRAVWGALVLLHGVLIALMWTAHVQVAIVRDPWARWRALLPVAIPPVRPPVQARAAPHARHRQLPAPARRARAAEPDRQAAAALPAPAARPGAGTARAPWRPPLNLDLPPAMRAAPASAPAPLTPAQEARRDPRSNRLVLTPQEQRELAAGNVECIAWQRDPDGTIFRGPGHWQPDLSLGRKPDGTYVMHCVDDAHQVAVPVLPMRSRGAHQ